MDIVYGALGGIVSLISVVLFHVWSHRAESLHAGRLAAITRALVGASPERARVAAREGGRRYETILGGLREERMSTPRLSWPDVLLPALVTVASISVAMAWPATAYGPRLHIQVAAGWTLAAIVIPVALVLWAVDLRNRLLNLRRMHGLVVSIASGLRRPEARP